MNINNEYETILNKLAKSKFRSSFHLSNRDFEFIESKGIEVIKQHTADFIRIKLADAFPLNDGKQTPTKNHPTFIAMHACACCCRTCLAKWHNIPMHKPLTNDEKNYIWCLLLYWLNKQIINKKN